MEKEHPDFYDFIQSSILSCPSQTVQWLLGESQNQGNLFSVQNLLLCTNDPNGDNFIYALSLKLPNKNTVFDLHYDELANGLGGYGVPSSGLDEYRFKIPHPESVLLASAMPQDSSIIASQSASNIFINNTAPPNSQDPRPSFSLTNTLENPQPYKIGVSWNSNLQGSLLSWSQNHIYQWTVEREASLVQTYQSNRSIEFLEWHHHHSSVLGSVGEEILIFDTRQKDPVIKMQNIHEGLTKSMAWNPLNEFLFVECSTDKNICLWDIRSPLEPLHQLTNDAPLNSVKWSPFHETVFASSDDQKVCCWNLADIGRKQTQEEQEDGPPELLFLHCGHTNIITDFSWNPNEEWIISSVSKDAILQTWKMAEYIYTEEAN